MDTYTRIKLTCGAIATIGLYSVLYRENKLYRFFEHMFLGLAAGWSIVAIWKDVLKASWWDRMVGASPESGDPGRPGFWIFAFLPFIGLMGYFVFSRRHNWVSRIPIGILLGFASGQYFDAFMNLYMPQIQQSLKPVLPTMAQFTVPSKAGLTPEALADINARVYGSQALSNIVFTVTLLSVMSYFLFSFDTRSRMLRNATTMGRWLLMIGFGAIFGSTVMMRFALLIDRMYFVWVEWLMHGVLRLK